MRFRTIVRSSAALWVAPVALALPVLFYIGFYIGSNVASMPVYGWAPSVAGNAELATTSLAYMLSAGLGVWESGRLACGGIWQMAPARSRYRIAAEVLAPVVGTAWSMHLVVLAVAFARSGVMPTLDSLRVLIVVLPLCVAHAVIGFAVGLRMPRLAAAPILAAGVPSALRGAADIKAAEGANPTYAFCSPPTTWWTWPRKPTT